MLVTIFLVCVLFQLQLPVNDGAPSAYEVVQSPRFAAPKPGESVTIHCSHSVSIFERILWYKREKHGALRYLGYMNRNFPYPEGDVKDKMNFGGDGSKHVTLNISTVSENDSAIYFCAASRTGNLNEAYFGKGTKLTVLDGTPVTPPTVKILQPSEKECKDNTGKKKKTLVCVASGFYPDHVGVSWTRNDQKITDGVSTDAAAKRGKDNYYKITSRLTIPINDWLEPNIRFKCIVSFYNGTANIETDDVFTTKGVDNPGMTRAKYLKITQNAKLSYSALIVKSLLYAALVCLLVWKLQGKRGKQTK